VKRLVGPRKVRRSTKPETDEEYNPVIDLCSSASSSDKKQELLPASQINATGLQTRDKLRRKLVEILCSSSSQTKICVDLALRLENALFKNYGFGKVYFDKSRSLIFNLTDKNNPEPIQALLQMKLEPEDFVTLDPRSLASETMKKERDAAMLRGLWNKRTDWDQECVRNNEEYKGMFKCKHCQSDRTGFV
jgi:hypothetical protein